MLFPKVIFHCLYELNLNVFFISTSTPHSFLCSLSVSSSLSQSHRAEMDRRLDHGHPTVITLPSTSTSIFIVVYVFSSMFYAMAKLYVLYEYVCHLFVFVCLFRGVCGCCGSELESIQLTAEEYQQLKDRVMTDVIQGQDVFNKTTPEVHTKHSHIPAS